jgi:Tfp pilus assembly protein PilO
MSGMILKDVKYETASREIEKPKNSVVQGGAAIKKNSSEYGVWDLSFSIEGSYSNFLNFTRDLENNLRIVDISSIQFSSETAANSSKNTAESYSYSFTVKTYWLKN